MAQFWDILGLVFIALILGLAMWAVIYSVRVLRRGDEVTAEEAVKWRHRVKNLGISASPHMNPNITDILVRAWRSLGGWFVLCPGVSALLVGIGGIVFFVFRPLQDGALEVDLWTSMFDLLFLGALALAVSTGGAIGLLMGFSRIRRGPHVDGEIVASRRLRDYRPIYVACYPLAVLIGEVVLMGILVLRLAPGLDGAALAQAFNLPYMWLVPVAPAILLIATIGVELLVRRIVSLPPLALPQDAEVRQLVDQRMRQWGVFRSYWCFFLLSMMTTQLQLSLLEISSASYYPQFEVIVSPLIRTNLILWFLGFWVLTMIGGMVVSNSVQPKNSNPISLWGRSNRPTESVGDAE